MQKCQISIVFTEIKGSNTFIDFVAIENREIKKVVCVSYWATDIMDLILWGKLFHLIKYLLSHPR